MWHWLANEARRAVAAQGLQQTREQGFGIRTPSVVGVAEVREPDLTEAEVIVHRRRPQRELRSAVVGIRYRGPMDGEWVHGGDTG